MRKRALGVAALASVAIATAGPGADSAGAAREASPPPAAAGVPTPLPPTVPDAVLEIPSRRGAEAVASDAGQRYRVNDGQKRSVFIRVSEPCEITCGANPQTVATFLGSLPHRDEINRLSVDLVTAGEVAVICGPGAIACYFFGQSLIVIDGDPDASTGGVSRNFVLAHEYGHHLANHRSNAPWLALDWGTKRWATYQRVCEGVRSGRYLPGDEGAGYFQNPGEAFAETYAFNRFPNETEWAWDPSLEPDQASFKAVVADAVNPWTGRVKLRWRARLADEGRRQVGRKFLTPLDGRFTAVLRTGSKADFDLVLKGAGGTTLASSTGGRRVENLDSIVCGLDSLRLIVRRSGDFGGRFKVTVRRP